jgi:predicted HicB family RNase H-like nuclease
MICKKYMAEIEFDEEAGIFHGEVLNTRDAITFQGTSVKELEREFKDSIEDYLAFARSAASSPIDPSRASLFCASPPESTAGPSLLPSARRWV